ncbi:MAG: dNTP triphosphohydrolase, partial [Candidatus Omnitrophota bacterium]|nr:dNTP triphosphohydrolase [Candidatus Omnitrophota bacterium]
MLKRKDLEKKEELLASYAQKSKLTKGRCHKEEEHEYRSCYQRDKDRIIYSTAFRRLEYKTQVFVNHEGDYYRTRLTHTLEVSQIAKSIARALKLNEDLVEAISLAHDLGHTPFGHSGEDALHELMREHGGFDHNTQGLRVVDFLEQRYPDFPGLNLTYEVREGIIKHSTPFDRPRPAIPFESKGSPLLEIQVVDIADEIAYDNHDLDDGIT